METRRNAKTEFRRDLIQACNDNDKTKLMDIFNEKYNTVESLDVIIAELVLECYLCIDVCDQIICQTVEKGYTDIVKILIEKSFNFIARTHKGFPVQIACKKGHLALVKDLIYHLKANTVSWQEYEGIESLVAISTHNGHLDILEFLVHNGASLNIKTILPLPFYATINGSQDVLKYLLQQLNSKFDINSVTRLPGNATQEFSLLHTACITRQLHIIKFLIDKRCVVTQAIVKRYPDCISDVLQQKISVYNVGEEGEEENHSAVWNGICMDCIPDKVIMDNYSTIVQIDLNSCHLKEVTHAVFLLPNVTLIDLSLNELRQLDDEPCEEWKCYKLEKLNASKNNLKQIPSTVFVNLPNLRVLDVSYNQIELVCSDETAQWNLPSIEEIQLGNNLIVAIPENMGSLCNLKILNVSNNRLDKVSSSLAQSTHKLDTLNLSKNRISLLPIGIPCTWGHSLQTLNLKENQFYEIPMEVCQLTHLNILIISHNHVKVFPPFRSWETQSLQRLDISHNRLFFNLIQLSSTPDERKFMNLFAQTKIKPTNAKTQPAPIEYSNSTSIEDTYEVPVDLWANTLMYLDLSDNKISVLPDYIGSLTSLVSLNLSNNRELNILPPALGRLKACYQLGVDNLRLNNALFNNIEGTKKTKSILNVLRTELRNSVPAKNMKLMVVGLAGQGKTTLLQVLKNGSSKNESHRSTATNGVDINKWTLGGKDTRIKLGPEVDFSTWDLGGQEVYYATHQCFLTKNTLYLLVFNLMLGEDAILHLQPWLLNIQARAPNSPVIIVGTHLDKFRDEMNRGGAEDIREKLRNLYFDNRQNKYPDIKAVEFVSCTKYQNIDQLIKIIYETASSLKTAETQEKVIGQMIPKSYTELQKLIEEERRSRRTEGKMLILEYKEMEKIAATVQDEELHDKAELDQAASYLHNNGHILHYDELIGQLSEIYFIDPTWICNMFSQIVTVKETNNWVRNGIIKESDLHFIFLNKDNFLFSHYQKEYLYIMEKFEVLINLGDGRLLIPSMLPLARPDVADQVIPDEYQFHPESPLENPGPLNGPICIREQSAIIRRRIYFAFIPSGFWNRLISRILVGIKRKEYCEPDDFSLNIDSKQILYWRRGIAMQFKDCRFVIESISRSSLEIGGMQPGEGYMRNTRILRGLGEASENPSEVEGVDITVHSSTYDFSWLGYLVDQVDNILKEWFPGLDEQDVFGREQVQRFCPWKIPKTLLAQMNEENKDQLEVISGNYYYMFKYQDCVLLSVKKSHFYLESFNVNIPLEFLIPEICLADLHEDFKLSVSELKFERKNSVIGEGATSNVFRGTYKNMQAAVKEFSYGNPNKKGLLKTSEVDIESTLQLLRMLRTEVSLQCRFQHPFILQLLGASIRPLVIVLELAPLGALSNELTERANKLNEEWINKYNATAPPPMPGGVLGHRMTSKIAMQVILAIEYLHNNKVIYRDLKAQNILLFSLNEKDVVNVKLSDYGISIVAQPSFNKGQEGTPGYIPPEGIAQRNFENVITEKVDIFAYGMVLYELITGRYPFYPRTAHQEVIKAVLNNINPDIFGQNRTPCYPNIINLMYECWRKSPAERPSAQRIIDMLITPAFYLLRNCVTEIDKEGMHKIDYIMDVPHSKIQPSSVVNRNLCVWGVETERKRCSLINIENKKKIESRLPTEQPVGAACVVEEEGWPARIWISTRGQRPGGSGYREIEIYGQVCRTSSYCCLWRYITKDTVLCLVADNINGKSIVYASLLSGHFHAYAKKADFENDRGFVSLKPHEYALTSERNHEECSQWKLVYILQIGNPPVHSILVVNNEIWCACGGDIHLLNRNTREYFHKLPVFPNKDTQLTQMVHHDGRVYATTFKGAEANVLVIDVGTRNVIGNMCCSEWNPTKQMVFIRNERTPGIKFVTQVSTVDEMDEEGMSMPIHVTELLPEESASSRTQFVMPLDSPSLRYYPKQSIRARGRSRLQQVTKRRDTCSDNAQKIVQESERKEVRIRSIMAREGLLWVGRAMGDILLIDIDTESKSYGQVLACLRLPCDDKTIYSAKSVSLLCPTQGKYIANYQQLLGHARESPREHITVWEDVGLKRLKEILAENEVLLTYT